MAEIDPVVLRLVADNNKYIAELRRTTRAAEQQLGQQERKIKQLERQMQQSSGKIGGVLKGLAGTLATYFTGRELVGLLDSFTRLQNNLRVAGLEGQALAEVQGSLLGLSQKYGVELESLSSVFLKASLAQKELGASTDEIIRLNEIVAASLKITGTSAEQARGALLQLGQALGSDIVRGEEFNSLLENALPLVQAAARGIDRFGGSVARLRKEVVDGKVSSREFFEGVLKGGVQTLQDAEKATLTLSGGFTALTSAITVYFGEADKANGVSAALGTALKTLADNLDILIPALAVVATAMGVQMVAGALAGTRAVFALQAVMGGAATAAEGLTFALAGLRAALPLIAITAVVATLGYLAARAYESGQRLDQLTESAKSTGEKADAMERRLIAAGVAMDTVSLASDQARNGIDGVSNAAVNAKTKLYDLEQQAIRTATKLIDLQLQENQRERVALGRRQAQAATAGGGRQASDSGDIFGKQGRAARSAEQKALDEEYRNLNRQRNAVIQGVRYGVDVNSDGGGSGTVATPRPSDKAKPGPAGRQGPSAADIEARFQAELANYAQQALSAMQSLATNAEDRAEFERRSVELARLRTVAEIEGDEDYSKAQKARLVKQVDALADLEREAIERDRKARLEQEAADLADERNRGEVEALRLQYDLADTQDDRRRIALEILDAEDRYLRSKLESVIASETALDAEKERARLALQSLNANAGARRESTERQFEGPLARYGRDAKDANDRVEEAAARRIRDLNQTIADTMANALGVKDPFLRDLLSIFLDQNIFGPLAEALSRKGTGGGGLLGGILGGIGSILAPGGGIGGGSSGFGNGSNVTGGIIRTRASGGYAGAGQMYRVNEGASPGRVEGFMPNVDGRIIPLGRMNAMRGGGAGGGTVRILIEEGPNFMTTIRTEAQGVAMEVTKASAPMIVKAAVGETVRQSNRPRL